MNDVVKTDVIADFKQRVTEKLKTDIGSLMPDDVLSVLVQQAVKELFFTKQVVPKPNRPTYSSETIEVPSWFEEEVIAQIQPLLKVSISEFISKHEAYILEVVNASLEKDKLQIMTAFVIGEKVKDAMMGMSANVMNLIRNSNITQY